LSILGLPYRLVDVNLFAGEGQRPAFLAKNPMGQIPVLEDGEVTLSDSNAILVYLTLRYAPESSWLPRDPRGAAEVQRWLSFAAGQLAYGPSAARRAKLLGAKLDIEAAHAEAKRLFAVMEQRLSQHDFLATPAPSLADIALYTYTAIAPEGGISLDPYPAIRAWLARLEATPRFVPMVRTPAKSA
jgi:glutathione S-transferase